MKTFTTGQIVNVYGNLAKVTAINSLNNSVISVRTINKIKGKKLNMLCRAEEILSQPQPLSIV